MALIYCIADEKKKGLNCLCLIEAMKAAGAFINYIGIIMTFNYEKYSKIVNFIECT